MWFPGFAEPNFFDPQITGPDNLLRNHVSWVGSGGSHVWDDYLTTQIRWSVATSNKGVVLKMISIKSYVFREGRANRVGWGASVSTVDGACQHRKPNMSFPSNLKCQPVTHVSHLVPWNRLVIVNILQGLNTGQLLLVKWCQSPVFTYPPVIKHGKGKSSVNGGLIGINLYKCGIFHISVFDYHRACLLGKSCQHGYIHLHPPPFPRGPRCWDLAMNPLYRARSSVDWYRLSVLGVVSRSMYVE